MCFTYDWFNERYWFLYRTSKLYVSGRSKVKEYQIHSLFSSSSLHGRVHRIF
nr:MAG TPA: hypothetical protein [Caudoviricetes sp.]